MLFSNYIMGILLLKGFKTPSDLKPYNGSTNPQEYIGHVQIKNDLGWGIRRCQVSSLLDHAEESSIQVVQLSLPPRSIDRFSDFSSQFLAHFTTRKFKLKLVSSLLRIS